MDRVAHRLKVNVRNESPQRILFFDTETIPIQLDEDTIEHRFRLGMGSYIEQPRAKHPGTKEDYRFYTVDDFWNTLLHLAKPKQRLIVVAHNIRFDIQVVGRYKCLISEGYECKSYIEKYKCYMILWRKDDTSILFLDNMNYFPEALEKYGTDLGIGKLEMPPFDAPNSVWFPYCERDVEILVALWANLIEFLRKYQLGNWQRTLASQAFSAFRHRFMSHTIYIHDNPKAIALERESYHGGRTEAHYLGYFDDDTYYYLDVNSMYPTVMANYDYPTNLLSYTKHGDRDLLPELLSTYAVIADCRIQTNDPVYALKRDGKLTFPIGEFWTVLTTNEIKYALEHKHLKGVRRIAVYDKAPIFRDYVDFFYTLRLEFIKQDKPALAKFAKLFLNTLYGKFGQKNETWEIVGQGDPTVFEYWLEIDMVDQCMYSYRQHDGIVERARGFTEAYNGFVAIASEVTANTRLYLYQLRKVISDDNIFYYDTDGFIVNSQGYANVRHLLSPTKLGGLKVDATANKLEIRGLKDYTFGDKVVRKGVKSDAIEVSHNVFEQWNLTGKNTLAYKASPDKCIFRRTLKHLSGLYTKGEVMEGGLVLPFNLAL